MSLSLQPVLELFASIKLIIHLTTLSSVYDDYLVF